MYKYNLTLKNKSDWISYAKNLLSKTDKSPDEMVLEILTFPFKFDGEIISQ